MASILQARYPVPREICRLWLTYQALAIYLLLGAVDVILMIRGNMEELFALAFSDFCFSMTIVYAFYNRRRWIGTLMIFLIFLRISLSSASAVMTVPNQEFNKACLNKNVPSVVMYFFMSVVPTSLHLALLLNILTEWENLSSRV